MPENLAETIIRRVTVIPKTGEIQHNGVAAPKPRKSIKQKVPIPKSKEDKRKLKKKLTIEEWRAQYGRALRADPGFQRAMQRLPPKHAALLVAWATNGNNIYRAAKALNYTPNTAKTIMATDGFQEAMRFVDTFVPSEERQWLEILPEAKHTLRQLLKSPDDKVRYLAAKDITDRAEGKAITRIDMSIRDESPSLSDAEMQLAFSIMQQAQLGFAETLLWMRAHPKEVAEWVAANVRPVGALPENTRGLPVIDADFEVVEGAGGEGDSRSGRILGPLLGFVGDWCPELERNHG